MSIRDRINQFVEENPKITVRSLSIAAGMSDSMLHKFLTGGTDDLKIKTAERLASAMSVDPMWLIFGEGSPERASEIALAVKEISPDQIPQVLRVLEAFKRTGTDG